MVPARASAGRPRPVSAGHCPRASGSSPLHLTPSLLVVTCATSSPGHETLSSHHPSYRHTLCLTRSHTIYNMRQPCHMCTTLSHACAHVTHLQAHILTQQVTHHLQHASAMSHTYNPLTRMCTHHLPCEHASSHTLCNIAAVECSNCSRLSITTGPGSSEALKTGVQLNSCDYFPIRLPA